MAGRRFVCAVTIVNVATTFTIGTTDISSGLKKAYGLGEVDIFPPWWFCA